MSVAQTIFQQLGANKFRAMTGAKNFISSDNSLMFMIPKAKNGINKIVITLNGSDLYDIKFYRIRAATFKLINEANNVYADGLQSIFTQYTGLDTHL